MIDPIERIIADWRISIVDNEELGRPKRNPNKLNYLSNDRICKIVGCANQFRINRTSGLCDNHEFHQHDLYLELHNPLGNLVSAPAHKDIIDALIQWSSSRNFGLLPFFSSLSFNTLGNVPDVSTLGGKVIHENIAIPNLEAIFDSLISVIEIFFPVLNNSSYQPLHTSKGNIPAIVLAHTFAGLLICEEANRADRWFCRMVIGDETKTTQLGAAMPIAYFATRIFPWGVEIGKSSRNLTK